MSQKGNETGNDDEVEGLRIGEEVEGTVVLTGIAGIDKDKSWTVAKEISKFTVDVSGDVESGEETD